MRLPKRKKNARTRETIGRKSMPISNFALTHVSKATTRLRRLLEASSSRFVSTNLAAVVTPSGLREICSSVWQTARAQTISCLDLVAVSTVTKTNARAATRTTTALLSSATPARKRSEARGESTGRTANARAIVAISHSSGFPSRMYALRRAQQKAMSTRGKTNAYRSA